MCVKQLNLRQNCDNVLVLVLKLINIFYYSITQKFKKVLFLLKNLAKLTYSKQL